MLRGLSIKSQGSWGGSFTCDTALLPPSVRSMKPVMGFPGPSHPSEPPYPRTPSLLMHGHAPPPGSLPSLPTQSSWHSVKSVLIPFLTLEQVYPSPTLPPTYPCPDQDLGGSFRRDNLFVSRVLGPSRWQEKHKLERIRRGRWVSSATSWEEGYAQHPWTQTRRCP